MSGTTVVRIFVNDEGHIEGQWMLEGVPNYQLMEALGMLTVAKCKISDMVDPDEMGEDDINSIRKLLDD